MWPGLITFANGSMNETDSNSIGGAKAKSTDLGKVFVIDLPVRRLVWPGKPASMSWSECSHRNEKLNTIKVDSVFHSRNHGVKCGSDLFTIGVSQYRVVTGSDGTGAGD